MTKNLEDLAGEFIIDGINIKSRDIMAARVYFSVAWGISQYFQNSEFIRLCERLLENTGLTKEEIKALQKYGYSLATIGYSLRQV